METYPLDRDNCNCRSGQRFYAGGKEYLLGGRIGDGAAGIVRKATDIASDKPVAVKFRALDPKYIDSKSFDDVAQRFKREGDRGAKLEHENLVKNYRI